jgi:hypothetical protein
MSGILRALGLALAAAMSLALAGCMTSTRPLFADATAVAALGKGGSYAAYERRDNGRYKRDEMIAIRVSGAGYDYIDEKGRSTPFTLHALDRSSFVAQAKTPDNYQYLVLNIRGAQAFIHVPDCDKQDQKKLAGLGVEVRQGDCVLDNVRDPKAAFEAIDFGKPTSKIVRQ